MWKLVEEGGKEEEEGGGRREDGGGRLEEGGHARGGSRNARGGYSYVIGVCLCICLEDYIDARGCFGSIVVQVCGLAKFFIANAS